MTLGYFYGEIVDDEEIKMRLYEECGLFDGRLNFERADEELEMRLGEVEFGEDCFTVKDIITPPMRIGNIHLQIEQ